MNEPLQSPEAGKMFNMPVFGVMYVFHPERYNGDKPRFTSPNIWYATNRTDDYVVSVKITLWVPQLVTRGVTEPIEWTSLIEFAPLEDGQERWNFRELGKGDTVERAIIDASARHQRTRALMVHAFGGPS